MASPTRAQLQDWAASYVALWNAGDKAGWIENWKRVAPGEIRMLDPVGTPEKRGFEECCAAPFDLSQDLAALGAHVASADEWKPAEPASFALFLRCFWLRFHRRRHKTFRMPDPDGRWDVRPIQ